MPQHRVLIVEDETLIAMQLHMLLSRAGFEVCGTVDQGEKAVEQARLEKPDVILMDIHLSGIIDGIEAAQQILTFSSAAIIFTTGYSDPKQKEHALALNPAGYLIKPVDLYQIRAILEQWRPE